MLRWAIYIAPTGRRPVARLGLRAQAQVLRQRFYIRPRLSMCTGRRAGPGAAPRPRRGRGCRESRSQCLTFMFSIHPPLPRVTFLI
jgi:hypothetical protein